MPDRISFMRRWSLSSIKGDVLDTRENTREQTYLIPSIFLRCCFLSCRSFDRHAMVQGRAVSPSQYWLLENLHEVSVIRFFRSASSMATHYDLFNYFIYFFFIYVHYVQLHWLFNYIDSMLLLFPSFSEVNLMIGSGTICQLQILSTCLDMAIYLFVLWSPLKSDQINFIPY
jgi:hypothetical protein